MKNSLKRTLGLGLSAVILLAGAIAGSLHYYITARIAETNFNNYKNIVVNNFAQNLAMHLWNFDEHAITHACTALLESRGIVGIRVFDEKNRVVFEKEECPLCSLDTVAAKEVYHDGNVIGQLEIIFSKQFLWESKKSGITATFIVVLAIVLSFFPLTQLVLTRAIINPIAKLARGAEIIGKGDLERKIEVETKNEIGELAGSFNEMTARLKDSYLGLEQAKERYRSFIVATNQIVWTAAPDGKVTEDIPQWREFTGQSFEEIKGSGWNDALHPEDRNPTLAVWFEAVKNRALYDAEYRVRRHDGEYRYLAARGVPVLNKDGSIREWVGTCTDITEKKRLEEIEHRLITIIEQTSDFVAISDAQANVLYVNKAGRRMLKIKEDEDITKSKLSDYHPAWQAEYILKTGIPQAIQDGVWQSETVFLSRDGTEVPTLQVIIAHKSADGSLVYLSTVARDISELKTKEAEIKKINEELRRYSQRIEAANKELEAFSYSASHDLRAPLRAIDGFSQALLEDYSPKLDEQGKDYINRVRSATQKMSGLIDALLSLSRQSRSEMYLEKVDLSGLVKTIAQALKETEPTREVEFSIKEGLVKDNLDRRLVSIALEKLLENAWKFTSKREAAKIEFGISEIEGKPAYFLRDNGCGFDMAYADKLFTPFGRLHSPEEFAGAGIGLTIVQRIIHRHGGRLWAEGEVGKGATFYFTL